MYLATFRIIKKKNILKAFGENKIFDQNKKQKHVKLYCKKFNPKIVNAF